MSTEHVGDDRDLEVELASPAAGRIGLPFDAICTGCQRIAVKRASLEDVGHEPQANLEELEAGDCTSFKHICHRCQTCTWWNPVAVLTGLIRADQEED
ncbi:hypothetical protein [Natronosalvus rutilus]|uniref:Uncharacterized protein n=1 Tax=Natronosalvus rutilus TaxID=2953753 RepID=A0A9E7SW31_9EURY|nr:hypothetical protein [Natronosalvus rutilus]UTF52828.1 hypothetical protein NGM29_13705 [Natronosalvus rutilus]